MSKVVVPLVRALDQSCFPTTLGFGDQFSFGVPNSFAHHFKLGEFFFGGNSSGRFHGIWQQFSETLSEQARYANLLKQAKSSVPLLPVQKNDSLLGLPDYIFAGNRTWSFAFDSVGNPKQVLYLGESKWDDTLTPGQPTRLSLYNYHRLKQLEQDQGGGDWQESLHLEDALLIDWSDSERPALSFRMSREGKITREYELGYDSYLQPFLKLRLLAGLDVFLNHAGCSDEFKQALLQGTARFDQANLKDDRLRNVFISAMLLMHGLALFDHPVQKRFFKRLVDQAASQAIQPKIFLEKAPVKTQSPRYVSAILPELGIRLAAWAVTDNHHLARPLRVSQVALELEFTADFFGKHADFPEALRQLWAAQNF
ncbi:MAG: hypothetical protein H7A33_01955 [Deltaproteobacteria bacterium]|nr:hypothetical protein [Deltaproteobacteria bacterium]